MAYGIAEGLSPYWILNEHNDIIGDYFFTPDLILILNLPAEEAIRRSGKSGKAADYFEEKRWLREKIRNAYLAFPMLMKEICRDVKMNIQIIDASLSPEKILKSVIPIIKEVFRKKKT